MTPHPWAPPESSGWSPIERSDVPAGPPVAGEPPLTIRPPGATPASPGPRRGRRVAAAGLVVAASLGAGFVGGRLGSSDGTAVVSSPIEVTSVSARFDAEPLDVAAAVANVGSSVVSVETVVQARRGPWIQEGEGAGTGIVISEDGLVLTNAHVVADATSITVTLSGETTPRIATLVETDPSNDIAVLRLTDTDGLVAAPIGDSDALEVGDQVVAIGNALALEGGMSVTQGIVSALGREIETEDGTLTGLIQTDTAISSGNSGGPLVNVAGEVVGINTAVATSSGSVAASNIGFVIPIDQALTIADRLTA